MPDIAPSACAVELASGARVRRATLLLAWPLAALVANTALAAGDGEILCPFRRLTGVPCPLCGGTHACVEFLHGDWAAAWAANPGVFVLFLLATVASLALLAEAAAGRQLWRPRRWSALIGYSGGAVFAAWIVRLAGSM